MTNDFYVYLHRRKSDGDVFYVGKGRLRRAWQTTSRNKHWHNIVSKHGFDVDIVICGLSETDALTEEARLIGEIGIDQLCNMTFGGDGMKSPTDEVKKRLSDAQRKNWENPEYREMISSKLRGRVASKETRQKQSKALTGRIRSEAHCLALRKSLKGLKKPDGYAEKMSAIKKGKMIGVKNPYFKSDLLAFSGPDFLFIGTSWHMASLNSIKSHNVENMKSGKSKNHLGWSFLGPMK